jgi:hypothetical protein
MIDLSTLSDPPSPWGRRTLIEGEITAVRIGPRDLWLTYRKGEVWIASRNPSPDVDPDSVYTGAPEPFPPEGVQWMRWVAPAGESSIVLRPSFPDRLLVLDPESPFHLLPRAEARVFVRVPLWIRVELILREESVTGLVLEEFPSALLSDTWWGDFEEGELAYWIPTTARREMRSDLFASHLGVCSLAISNLADTELRVEKLALRSTQLSIFSRDSALWSDTAQVTYRGDEEETVVEVTGRPPEEATGGVRVTLPRSPMQKGFRARNFGRLLTLSGMGGS